MYLVWTNFFGSRVIKISDKQEKELKKIYKISLLTKLKLGEKFLRQILYTRRIALGVGIIQPCTAIAMATLRLYFGNIRTKSNAGNMILALEELQEANTGYSKRAIEMIDKQWYLNWD